MLSGLRKIWAFADKERINLNKSVIFEFVYAIFNMLQIGAIYFVLQALVTKDFNSFIALKVFLMLLVSIVGRSSANYFAQLDQTHAGYFMVANRRISIGKMLKMVPMGFFNENNIGKVTGVLTTVLDDVENTAPMVLVVMMSGFINSFVFTLMILFFEWRNGLIVIAGTVLYLYITSVMEKKSRTLAPKRQEAQSLLVETILEYIQGMAVIKSFNLTGKGDQTVRSALEESRSANLALEKLFTPYTIGQELVLRISSVAMIVFSLYFYINGTIDLLKAIMCIIMSFLVFASIQSAGSAMATLRVATSSIEQVETTENMPQMDIEGKKITPHHTDIEFNNVSFSYDKIPILREVSIHIPEKAMTAIIGPSGSGKSTMCSLISRFWDVDQGSISIGDINIKNYTLESLMDLISTVFQNVYLFQDTIEKNIKFGKPQAKKEEVIEAAKKAQCHDFIMNLPEGYQTIIGEGGTSLSGGEKQRISIARAMIKDAPIIIFDEATANVDPENEDKLQNAMESLTKDKTVIMIAHRLKTIRNADQIIVLRDGIIEEVGKHEDLIRKEGTYKKFIEAREETESWKIKQNKEDFNEKSINSKGFN
ncbi:ABC transporter ATP-binding protein [Anaerococcus rubeinfantis]|uniref:ABC transporter ATP-binding protein n=1 Tax=Anaerococcus rubeinfantis TaxID=1720199 RepID=UPI00073F3B67|nr:ABC transporter ATP-binding protein [Anaerococcus rubeinfantis]